MKTHPPGHRLEAPDRSSPRSRSACAAGASPPPRFARCAAGGSRRTVGDTGGVDGHGWWFMLFDDGWCWFSMTSCVINCDCGWITHNEFKLLAIRLRSSGSSLTSGCLNINLEGYTPLVHPGQSHICQFNFHEAMTGPVQRQVQFRPLASQLRWPRAEYWSVLRMEVRIQLSCFVNSWIYHYCVVILSYQAPWSTIFKNYIHHHPPSITICQSFF